MSTIAEDEEGVLVVNSSAKSGYACLKSLATNFSVVLGVRDHFATDSMPPFALIMDFNCVTAESSRQEASPNEQSSARWLK